MDLSHNYLYNQTINRNYPLDNIKSKKTRKQSPNKRKTFINNNILQFSLNAINSLFINNLNSSVSLGFLNLTNDYQMPKILNNNIYLNSLYDTIDYKIRGNIYKQDKNLIINHFPKLIPLLTSKSYNKINRHEIKIMKLDKDIITPKNKTPIKKLDKHYYSNLMKNNSENRYQHFKHNSENIDNNLDKESEGNEDIKKSKIINNCDNYAIYRTYTTINSKDKNIKSNANQNNTINHNKIAYKKKSPTKKFVINKIILNPKDISKKDNQDKTSEPKNQISFKNKFIYKVIKTNNNSPNKLILPNKKKENYLSNKNKEILNNKKPKVLIKTQLPKQIKHEHSQSYNIQSYKPMSNTERSSYYNSNNINEIKTSKNKNIIINRNNNINMSRLDKTKFLTLTNINSNNNKIIKEKNLKNKNLNIKYIPPSDKLAKVQILPKQKNKNKYVLLNKTINNSNNSQKIKNAFYANKNNNMNNKNNHINNLYEDDESSLFKVIDYTQIMTQDEFSNSKNSLTNSNKLNQLNGSNGTNTNQETDYNSLKKFNNNNFLTNEDFGDNNYYNSGNDININFSFNNFNNKY